MTATTLTADEMQRVKRELLDNILSVGAWPFVDIKYVYTVIQTNITSSTTAPTTSSTAITSTGAGTITLWLATGITVGTPVVIDCDDQRETVTVKSLSGSVMGANFRKLHSGTYNVEPESSLTIFRGVMWDLSRIQDEINQARPTAGIAGAADGRLYGAAGEKNRLAALRDEQSRLRMDLASMCGLREYFARANARARGAGGGSFSV